MFQKLRRSPKELLVVSAFAGFLVVFFTSSLNDRVSDFLRNTFASAEIKELVAQIEDELESYYGANRYYPQNLEEVTSLDSGTLEKVGFKNIGDPYLLYGPLKARVFPDEMADRPDLETLPDCVASESGAYRFFSNTTYNCKVPLADRRDGDYAATFHCGYRIVYKVQNSGSFGDNIVDDLFNTENDTHCEGVGLLR